MADVFGEYGLHAAYFFSSNETWNSDIFSGLMQKNFLSQIALIFKRGVLRFHFQINE